MSAVDANIEIIKQTPYFFTDSVTNDMIMYTGLQTQHMLFGTTSNDSSIINLYNSNVTFNRLGNFSCNLTIGSNSYIGITNYVALQTNIDFAAVNSSNDWAINHGGKALYMRYSTFSSNDASYIQSIYRDGLSTNMLDMQIQASNLHLCTGNTSTQIQATVKPDGKVGIGTSNPSENLHVRSNFRINGNIALDALMPIKLGSNVATNTAAQIGFNLMNNSNFLDIIGGATATQTGRQIYFWIDSNQTGGVPGRATFEGGTVWLTTGSLGICRSNPVSLLHLTSNSACFTSYTNTINSNTGIIVGIENNAPGGMIYNTSNSYLKFGTNNVERMKIQSNGYIGVGVSNPTSILHVHNPISTECNIIHMTNAITGSNAGNGFDINLDTNKNISIWNYENGYISFGTSNRERVRISTSNTKMVQVNGDIFVTNGWNRIDGSNPFYFDTYGGGWFMNDTTWIKAFADKSIYTNGIISTSNKLSVGVGNPNLLLEVKNNTGTGGWLSSFSNSSVVTLISDSSGNGLLVKTGQLSTSNTFAITLCNENSNLFRVGNNGVATLSSNLSCAGIVTSNISCGTLISSNINTNSNSILCGTIRCSNILISKTSSNSLECGNINCLAINTNNCNITCSNVFAMGELRGNLFSVSNSSGYFTVISSSRVLTNVTMDANIITTGTISTARLPVASLTTSGIVQLNDTVTSTSITQAATPSAVKSAYDLANAAMPKSGGTFTNAVSGTSFSANTLISTVATGTAPLTVTSTTRVNNLNAQYLNGLSSSSFATATSLSSYATVASLSGYATTSSLSSYATTSSLSSLMPKSGGTFTSLINCSGIIATVGSPGDAAYSGYHRCIEFPKQDSEANGPRILSAYGDILIIIGGSQSGQKKYTFDRGGGFETPAGITANGTITGTTKNFKIAHPTRSNYDLYHASIEGPRYDLIYRGKSKLQNGKALVNVCLECNKTGGMTPDTLNALGRDFDLFLQNKTSFSRLIGSYSNEIITVHCEDNNSQDEFSWMLICERNDEYVKDSKYTDSNGSLIAELVKEKIHSGPL